MTVREFLVDQIHTRLMAEYKEKSGEEHCDFALRRAEEAIRFAYGFARSPMKNDPRKLLPVEGVKTEDQAKALTEWRKKAEAWGNFPELVGAIEKAEFKLANIPRAIEFFYPLKSRQPRKMAENLAVYNVTLQLKANKVQCPEFWAAAILADCGYPLLGADGDFVSMKLSSGDAKVRSIENLVRGQNTRTKGMMTKGEYGRIEALQRDLDKQES